MDEDKLKAQRPGDRFGSPMKPDVRVGRGLVKRSSPPDSGQGDYVPGKLLPVRMRPKITDVAKLCGVTPATVSRVLNGKTNFRASEEVREKIMQAILLQSPTTETVSALNRRHVPYVYINERIGDPLAYVISDDAMGMTRVLDHLHQLGHKRLAYANARATYFSHYSVTERYSTLLKGCQDRGINLAAGHEVPFGSASDFLRRAVLDQRATAVIAYEHQIAVALVGAAYTMELRVPRDFNLICFNDVFPVSVMAPPLTCVSVSGQEMGRIGADVLLNNLLAPQGVMGRVIKVPENLIVRASTCAPGGL
jgi:DNA-binding LacI/PurR family transcriptional regulator